MRSPLTLSRYAVPLALLILVGGARCQMTTVTIPIGGVGASGCHGGPVLSQGTAATGSLTIGYAAQAGSGMLSVTVTNGTQVSSGMPPPKIRCIHFNLPHLVVGDGQLVGMDGMGETHGFLADFDVDLTDGNNRITADCLGAFGVAIGLPPGVPGGIIPAGTTMPGPGDIIGPVTFDVILTGPGVQDVTAETFASALNYNPTGPAANAAFDYAGGGTGGTEFGAISNALGCSPGVWTDQPAAIGTTFRFVMSGTPGCFGLLLLSKSPGPTSIGGQTFPIGLPFLMLTKGLLSPTSVIVHPMDVPNEPVLIGVSFYSLVVLDDGLGNLESSVPFRVTII